ncbi:catalase family protein [Sodalis sp. RH22]|uniref:catalase family protein n=1 Tax=unclassified Sodalis (in: enterobacteria) TaxID=2636512 RepID=UPI0039B6BFA6
MARAALRPAVPFTPSVETYRPDEEQTHRQIADVFKHIIGKTHRDLGHAQRGVHAKSHALLQGRLVVHSSLAPELAQGIFARPRSYDVLLRISTIPGDVLRDGVSLPRGLAIKVLDVAGERLPGSENDLTQDFLLATGPAFTAADSRAFLKNLKLLAATTGRAEWAKAALSAVLRPLVRALKTLDVNTGLLQALGGYPLTNPLGDRYFTQVASRFGDYIAKLDVVPESANFLALAGKAFALAGRRDALREEVARILAREGGAWTLRAQLCRDLAENPVEDASVAWPEQDNPYLPLASIIVEPQQSWSPGRSRAMDDGLSFQPWHGVTAHRPLGDIMRARRLAYPVSVAQRSDLNQCPVHEPRQPPAC